MPALSVAQVRVHPGKVQAFTALCKEAKQLFAKQGLSTRLFAAQLAGPNVGTYSFVAEAADLVALATGLQHLFADSAYMDLTNRTFGPDGVCTAISFGQATEVPL